jgi:hypothetical protein
MFLPGTKHQWGFGLSLPNRIRDWIFQNRGTRNKFLAPVTVAVDKVNCFYEIGVRDPRKAECIS